MNLNAVIDELHKFSNKILTLSGPLNGNEIYKCEKNINKSLPNDYKEFLRKHNGGDLMGTEIYGINESENSLDRIYKFEHDAVENPMPDYFIPFSPNGEGNHYVFDTRNCNNDSCMIIFWQHDFEYSNEDIPEITHNSFTQWVKQVMIDWTLEDYDYNGNEK